MNSKLFWEITEGQEFNFRWVKSQRKAKLILNKNTILKNQKNRDFDQFEFWRQKFHFKTIFGVKIVMSYFLRQI